MTSVHINVDHSTAVHRGCKLYVNGFGYYSTVFFFFFFLVVLLHNGEVYAFGSNSNGQLGQGNTKPRYTHTCTHTHTHTHKHTHTHTHTDAHTNTHKHTHVYTFTCTHIITFFSPQWLSSEGPTSRARQADSLWRCTHSRPPQLRRGVHFRSKPRGSVGTCP